MPIPKASAFAVYQSLATTETLPPPCERALAALRAVTEGCGGRLTVGDLPVADPLASVVAATALRKRAALQSGGAASLGVRELTPTWFAASFADMLLGDAAAQARRRATTSSAIHHLQQLENASAEPERDPFLGTGANNPTDSRVSQARTAAHDAPEMIAAAADRLAMCGAEALYAAANAGWRDPLGVDAATNKAVLDELSAPESYALRVAAAREQDRSAFLTLPVLEATAMRLKAEGLLDATTFRTLKVGIRTHVLPSLHKLVEIMRSDGGLRDVSVSGKGVSTSPITACALERIVKRVDPGYGDGLLSAEEHRQRLLEEVRSWIDDAQRSQKPLLVLGDGWDCAEACTTAAVATAVPMAYVELTQSGHTFLASQAATPFAVHSLATTHVKKLVECTFLGDWLVDHEAELSRAQGLPGYASATAVVVGYGQGVGESVAHALRARGCGQVIVVEPDAARAAQARSAGFDVRATRIHDNVPPAQYYFSCVGRPNTIDAGVLHKVPAGSVVVNCASRGELDVDVLLAELREGRARFLEESLIPEQRTLVSSNGVFVRKVGQPLFDGRRDKDAMLADLYMAGLLCCMCLAARELNNGGGSRTLRPLPAHVQDIVLCAAEKFYGERLVRARLALGRQLRDEPPPPPAVDYRTLFASLPPDAQCAIEQAALCRKFADDALGNIASLNRGHEIAIHQGSHVLPFSYVELVLKEAIAENVREASP